MKLLDPTSCDAVSLSQSVPRYRVSESSPFYTYTYGTAGFRDRAEVLPSAMSRVGMLAALESMSVGGLPVGVVVTASHNKSSDNGAKIMDHQGEMLAQSWEQFATDLANAEEGEPLINVLNQFITRINIDIDTPAKVFVGRDTRESSPFLQEMIEKGAASLGAVVYDAGQLTTPQLHWIIRALNQDESRFESLDNTQRHQSDLKVYNENLQDSLSRLLLTPVEPLTVDCANGIGAVALNHLKTFIGELVPITLININTEDSHLLNNGVGAEHVQKTRSLPAGINNSEDTLKKFASVDGDADRVVYFFLDDSACMHLLDGDKIIALIAGYLGELVLSAGLELNIGVVQTAYANGSATTYLKDVLKIEVVCMPTGVKFLHHKAAEYDIGIYFEANGHGTVLFDCNAIDHMKAAASSDASNTSEHKAAAERLLALTNLINQAVGDAISDILLVEVVLAARSMTLMEWSNMYTDLPSHQDKIRVADRAVVVTTDAERRVESPPELQEAIDAAVAQFTSARAFVRPSGTEDVVRTYAEASTEEDAKKLGELVGQAVFKHAGGVQGGDRKRAREPEQQQQDDDDDEATLDATTATTLKSHTQ